MDLGRATSYLGNFQQLGALSRVFAIRIIVYWRLFRATPFMETALCAADPVVVFWLFVFSRLLNDVPLRALLLKAVPFLGVDFVVGSCA